MKILNVNFSFNTIGEKLSDELSGLKETSVPLSLAEHFDTLILLIGLPFL